MPLVRESVCLLAGEYLRFSSPFLIALFRAFSCCRDSPRYLRRFWWTCLCLSYLGFYPVWVQSNWRQWLSLQCSDVRTPYEVTRAVEVSAQKHIKDNKVQVVITVLTLINGGSM